MTDEDVHRGCEHSGSTSCKLPFLTLCLTRWLVREVLQRMLCNWNHLKPYFSTSVFNQSCRYKARTLADMLFDDVNYLYSCFLTPVVKEVDKINKFFQATNADPEDRQLHMHYASLKLRVFDKDGNHLAISRVDFGSKLNSESIRCSHEHRNSSNSNFSVQLRYIQDRCQNFLLQRIEQNEQRLPSNKDIFAGLSILKPPKVLSTSTGQHLNNCPFKTCCLNKVLMKLKSNTERFSCSHGMKKCFSLEFQIILSNFGLQFVVFKTLLAFVHTKIWLHMLWRALVLLFPTLLLSVCSDVNDVKTDKRNRMGLKMVKSISRIPTTLVVKNKCSKDFVVTKEMLHRFNSDMYETAV